MANREREPARVPGERAGRAAIEAGLLLPVALFALLALITWLVGGVDRAPAFLAPALGHAREVRELGEPFLRGGAPAADPRVLPAAGLLILGLPAGGVVLVVRLAGLLLGATAVALLARDSRAQGSTLGVGALWLAVSSLWIESVLACEPYVVLGLAFLLLSRRAGPVWVQVLAAAWSLAWYPWAWIIVPPLLLGGLLDASRPRWRGAAILLVSLAALWILNPNALLDPGGWLADMRAAAQGTGAWGGHGGGFGLRRSLLPLTGSLHVAGVLLVLAAAPGWAGRCRSGDLSPLVALGVLALAARGAFASLAPILILLPWGAGEAGRGWSVLTRALHRPGLRRLGWVLLAMLLLPSAAVLAGRWQRPAVAGPGADEVAHALALRLRPGSLVVHDAGFAPPDSSRLVWLGLPFHARDPALYAGAYWPGWYRAASAFVVSEDLVMRFVRTPERSAAMVQFYTQLAEGGGEEVMVGASPGHRTRILLRQPESPRLGAGWRERVNAGVGGDLPGAFVASLGAALAAAGGAGDCVELLEHALAAGYTEVGIYLNLASAQLELGQVMQAGRVLDEAHRRYPESPEVLYNLGLALSRAELWNRAARTFARVQQQWPRSAQVSYLLGVALANDGQPAAAARQIRQALDFDPGLPQRAAALELLERLEARRP